MRTRIMYIEDKSAGLTGPCRIGRVQFSKTGATLHYGDRGFKSLTGSGFKANYFDQATGEEFWISGPRRDGADGLYGRVTQPEDVDDDVAEAYWKDIRGLKSTPIARKDPGDNLRPSPEDRLPFANRNAVEHHRSDTRDRSIVRRGRKAGRIEHQVESLSVETKV